MITNKDIRVENGFLIINGDKYPLDGQSPEAIMQIVKDNSDTTPTENSDAPITSGGVFAVLKSSFTETTLAKIPFKASSTNYEYTGCSYTVPQGKTAILYALAQYVSSKPVGILLSWRSNSLIVLCATECSGEYVSRTPLAIITGGNTIYVWEKRDSIPTYNNESTIMGILI